MKTFFNVLILIAVVGAIAWGVVATQKMRKLQQEKAALESQAAEQTARIHHLEHVQEDLEEAKNAIQESQPQPPVQEVIPAESPAESEEAADQEIDSGEVSEEKEEDQSTESQEDRIIKAQIGIMVDMGYNELFNVLDLSSDVQPTVRDYLVGYAFTERSAIIRAIREGNTPAREVLKEREKAMTELRSKLTGLLSSEEMATWEEYEKYKNQNLYESLLEGQLAMLAPNLTEDNRKLAKQVIAEELDKSINEFEASEEIYTLDHFNQAQSRALQHGLDRLVESLPEKEFLELEKFTKVAEDMFRAASANQQ
jgi:hypothetical protein